VILLTCDDTNASTSAAVESSPASTQFPERIHGEEKLLKKFQGLEG
jgi:hypothetical protein